MWWHYVLLSIITLVFFVIMYNAGYKQCQKNEWKKYKKMRESNKKSDSKNIKNIGG